MTLYTVPGARISPQKADEGSVEMKSIHSFIPSFGCLAAASVIYCVTVGSL